MNRGGKYHFTGIGGVGMSAVAQAALHTGCTVTGSDRAYDDGLDASKTKSMPAIDKLKRAGIVFFPQDGSGVTPDISGVVVSTAIEDDNPDVIAANKAGIPLIHRSEMLAGLIDGAKCVAITGTCGKSTVTGMTGHILDMLGASPSVVNGAPVLNWKDESHIGNFRGGNAGLWIIEADESDRSLLNYHPDYALITNASADHFSEEDTLSLFRSFSVQVKTDVINIVDNPEMLRDFHPALSQRDGKFTYKGVEFYVPVPGSHNAENAYLAVLLCERLGFEVQAIRDALSAFRGIERRMEAVGTTGGVTVVDDYAHNPVKIRAVWTALAPYSGKMLAVWRPHGYGPLRAMLDGLSAAFSSLCRQEDRLFIMPVYDAGGTADRSIGAGDLVSSLAGRGLNATVVDPADLPGLIADLAVEGDTVLVMGARDPGLPQLAREILEECIKRQT